MPEVGLQSLCPTSGTVLQIPLPTPEVAVGAVVSIAPEMGLQSLAPTSGRVSQTAASQADASKISTTISVITGTSNVQFPLPAPEVTVETMVSVASKHYEISEKLGRCAGGSVHRATPRGEATDTGAGLCHGGPDTVALKLAGGKVRIYIYTPLEQ
eukprot:5083453-Amphidinium_carterae.2